MHKLTWYNCIWSDSFYNDSTRFWKGCVNVKVYWDHIQSANIFRSLKMWCNFIMEFQFNSDVCTNIFLILHIVKENVSIKGQRNTFLLMLFFYHLMSLVFEFEHFLLSVYVNSPSMVILGVSMILSPSYIQSLHNFWIQIASSCHGFASAAY